MGIQALPDMYALGPAALRHTYQTKPSCPCYNYYIYIISYIFHGNIQNNSWINTTRLVFTHSCQQYLHIKSSVYCMATYCMYVIYKQLHTKQVQFPLVRTCKHLLKFKLEGIIVGHVKCIK